MRVITLAIVLLILSINVLIGQTRYLNEVFPNVTVTPNITYGQNYSYLSGTPSLGNLTMDVYTPTNDNAGGPYYDANRPVVVFLHSGYFLPKGLNTFPFGNNRDSSVVEICRQFAKRGYVAAAINYRLGWNPFAASQVARAKSLVTAIYLAAQDARAAIRFFRKDAATSNTYRIDPYRVVLAGMQSGGMAALALNSLNRYNELLIAKLLDGGTPFIDTASLGGIYGQGGNSATNVYNHPGYSSVPQVVLNLGGAIVDTSWLNTTESPVVSFHGIDDIITPYFTFALTVASTGNPVVEVSGSHDLNAKADAIGLQSKITPTSPFTDAYTTVAQSRTSIKGLFPFPGATNGYEPWSWYDPNDNNIDNTTPGASGFGSRANPFATKAKALAYIDTIMGFFVPRSLVAFSKADSLAVQTPDPGASLPVAACTPNNAIVNPGFYPVSVSNPTAPCFTIGQNSSSVVYFQNFDQVSVGSITADVDSIRIDSVLGLPCGITWSANKASRTYAKLETGCLTYEGTSNAIQGVYKPEIIVTAWIVGGPPAGIQQQASTIGIRVNVKSVGSGVSCASVTDTVAGNGCNLLTVSFASTAPVCDGEEVVLAPNVSGGTPPYTYAWSSTSNSLSCTTCANPVATINNGSSISVTVTDANLNTANASVSYTVLPRSVAFSVSPSTVLCDGDTATLSVTNATGFLWGNGATTNSIEVTQDGNYTVTVTFANGCTATDSEFVGFSPAPAPQNIVGNPSIVPFQTYSYTVSPSTQLGYDWSVVGGVIQSGVGSNSIDVVWDQNGPYSVTLVQTNGIGCTTTATLSVFGPNGINDNGYSLHMQAYPNPTQGNMVLDVETPRGEVIVVEVLSVVGGALLTETHALAAGTNSLPLDLTQAAAGIYLIKLSTPEGAPRGSYKLLKQ